MLYLLSKGSLCKQMPEKVKKLITVLTTSMSMIDMKTEEKLEELKQVSYTWYLVTFKD